MSLVHQPRQSAQFMQNIVLKYTMAKTFRVSGRGETSTRTDIPILEITRSHSIRGVTESKSNRHNYVLSLRTLNTRYWRHTWRVLAFSRPCKVVS